jgi:hypothetical protein
MPLCRTGWALALLLLGGAARAQPPTLLAPTGLTRTALDLDLVWAGAHAADVVELATARTFSPATRVTLPGAGAAPGGTFALRSLTTPLQNDRTYYWRVRRGADVSAPDSFRTVVAAALPGADYPSAGLEMASARFRFGWNLGTGGTGYTLRLQVRAATSPADWSVTVIDTTGTDLRGYTTRDGQLRDSTQYVWRVAAFVPPGSPYFSYGADIPGIGAVRSVGYSSQVPFSIRPLLVQPAGSWPSGADVVPTPAFSWYVTGPADGLTYALELADLTAGGTLTGTPTVQGLTARTYTPTTPLVEGHQYTWRVRACGGTPVRCTAWSALLTFTVRAATVVTPVASWPVGDAVVYGTPGTLRWYASGAAAGQRYVVYTRLCDQPTCSDAPAPSLPGTGYTASAPLTITRYSLPLLPGRGYAWYVRALGPGDVPAAASALATFRTYSPPAPVAVPTWPVGNPDLYTNRPVLSWSVEGTHGGAFEVRYGTSADPDAATHTATAPAGSRSFTVPAALAWGTTYHWHVRPQGQPAWRSAAFTTIGQPGTLRPVRATPPDDAVMTTATATLGWYLDGSSLAVAAYEVQVSTHADFSAGTTTATVAAPAQTFTTAALTPGATYHWRVRASNGTAFSPWSTTGRFSRAAGAGTVVPVAASPAAYAEAEAAPTLSWALPVGSTAALAYDVEIARSASMAGAERLHVPPGATLAALTARGSGTHYWRVRSRTADGAVSAFSEVAAFIVYGTATAAEAPDGAAVLRLDAPQPHPVRGAATVAFALPAPADVSLEVFDLTGRRVRTLAQALRAAGAHTVAWDGTDDAGHPLASGLYVLRLRTPDGARTRPVVLVR